MRADKFATAPKHWFNSFLRVCHLAALSCPDCSGTVLAYGGGALWALNQFDGTLLRIDPNTNSVSGTIEVGKGFWAIPAIGADTLWLVGQEDGVIKRVNLQLNKVVDEFSVGAQQKNGIFRPMDSWGSYSLSLGADALWVADAKENGKYLFVSF